MGNLQTCESASECQTAISMLSNIHDTREVESFYSGVFALNHYTQTLLLVLCFLSAVGYGSMFLLIYFDKKLQAHPMRLLMYGALLGCIIFTQFTFMPINPYTSKKFNFLEILSVTLFFDRSQ